MTSILLAMAETAVENAVGTAVETAAGAAPYISQEVASSLNQNAYEPNIFGVILSLVIVLALIYATSYFYQKLIKFNAKMNKNDIGEGKNEFTVLSGTSLGQGKNLHVVEINETYLVLGSTPNNITLLKEFSKKDVVAQKTDTTLPSEVKNEKS